VVDFGIGNLGSVANMLTRVGGRPHISDQPSVLANCKRIILPGVGSFDAAMKRLSDTGMSDLLQHMVRDRNVPILGICLGMQLFAARSEEGRLPGLGWIPATVVKFRPAPGGENIRVPHIGWNGIARRGNSPLLEGIEDGSEFYFVHSFHLDGAQDTVIATANYGRDFAAMIQKGRIFGAQCHPEKSQDPGERLFHNFLRNIPN
jgi:glutamine amidotransferase